MCAAEPPARVYENDGEPLCELSRAGVTPWSQDTGGMFALIGLAVYIVLEFLRPEVLFGADLPIMFWVAVATLGIWLTEFSLRGWKWKTFPSTRFFCCFLAVAMVSSVFNHATGEKLLLDFSDISKLLCIDLVLVESTDSPRKLDFVLAVMLLAILFLAVEAIA